MEATTNPRAEEEKEEERRRRRRHSLKDCANCGTSEGAMQRPRPPALQPLRHLLQRAVPEVPLEGGRAPALAAWRRRSGAWKRRRRRRRRTTKKNKNSKNAGAAAEEDDEDISPSASTRSPRSHARECRARTSTASRAWRSCGRTTSSRCARRAAWSATRTGAAVRGGGAPVDASSPVRSGRCVSSVGSGMVMIVARMRRWCG